MKGAVTTSINGSEVEEEYAKELSLNLEFPFINRSKSTITSILCKHKLDFILVVEKNGLVIKSKQSELFWHPSTSIIKIKQLKNGGSHPLISALNLNPNSTVLDCTLGLGSDAVVIASQLKEGKNLTCLEVNPLIYELTNFGFKICTFFSGELNEKLKNVVLINEDSLTYLKSQKDTSVDIVYLDPMFKLSNEESNSINLYRGFAYQEPLTDILLSEALRVAKYRVVVKMPMLSYEYRHFQFDNYVGGSRYGDITYGYISKDNSFEQNSLEFFSY
jgi:16S rRNA G966 N2-methylase RsmD